MTTDNEIRKLLHCCDDDKCKSCSEALTTVKSLLSSQRSDLIKEIREKLAAEKKTAMYEIEKGWNAAINGALSILDQMEK